MTCSEEGVAFQRRQLNRKRSGRTLRSYCTWEKDLRSELEGPISLKSAPLREASHGLAMSLLPIRSQESQTVSCPSFNIETSNADITS